MVWLFRKVENGKDNNNRVMEADVAEAPEEDQEEADAHAEIIKSNFLIHKKFKFNI